MKTKKPPQLSTRLLVLKLILLMSLLSGGAFQSARAQTIGLDRQQGQTILAMVREDIRKNYYDPKFHGLDLDARFKEADEKIKQANSNGEILGIIGQTVMELNDSHTFFYPPRYTVRIEHGWLMQMIGDKCYVVAVEPGSDAEAKGLKPGDRLLAVEGYRFGRADLWKLRYIVYALSPRSGMKVIVEKPDGRQQQLTIQAKVHEGKLLTNYLTTGVATDTLNTIIEMEIESKLNAHRYIELGDDALIWKMPEFDLSEKQVDEMMDKARKRKALILDLRGNPGGSEETLLRLLGYFTDHDLTIGTLKRRNGTKPVVAKTRGDHVFKGQVVVLVDSDSASSAEIFARIMQLEKRGKVIGDQTSGEVMRARIFPHQLGAQYVVEFGTSVTDADLVMSDGQSLENVGLKPDELLLPTAADLAAQRDPVMARAAELVGLKITPEKAGTFFPVQWRK